MSRGRTVASLIVAFLLAGACGDAPPPREQATTWDDFCRRAEGRVSAFLDTFPPVEGPRTGGTAVVAGLGELANGMNALAMSDYVSQQHQAHVGLMTLVRYDERFEPAPWLARSWEVDPEQETLTFHLRDDVVWHDGVPTTAHDVAFTFLRAVDPETAYPNAGYWEFYEPRAEVVDSYTVRLHVPPHAEMFDPWRMLGIMPAHLLEEVPPGEIRNHPWANRCPVGNGPFRFVEHRPEERWTFERNPAFPEELGGPPPLDRLVYRIFDDQTTVLTELLTGGVDVYIGARADQLPAIRRSDEARVERFQFRNVVFVGWNSRRPELADPRVRRALTLATDRREIVDGLLAGHARIVNSTVPPFHWAFQPDLSGSLGHDLDGARRLLDEAGWSDRDGDGVRENAEGRPLELGIKYNEGNQLRRDVAEIMQAHLARVGVAVRPEVVDYGTLIMQLTDPDERDFDGVVMQWIVDFRHDDTDIFHSKRLEGPLAWAGLDDPEVDRLLDTLKLIPDRDQALPLWRDYQLRIMELQPYTFLFSHDRLAGIRTRLRGVEMDARGEWVTVHEWWIDPDGSGGRGASR